MSGGPSDRPRLSSDDFGDAEGSKYQDLLVATNFVISLDGTRIAFDQLGQGLPVIVVSGMFCTRQTTQPLAELLAQWFRVVNYDRRGRGDSDDTAPYDVEREVGDLAALIAEVGGAASVYGHSSGAGLAIHAAARGLPITRLVLHEPPYGPDDEESKREARALADNVRAALAADRQADAIRLFFNASGMPAEIVEEMSRDPKMRAVASTMSYDFEVMGDSSRGGTIPEDLVRAISVPTLVIAGDTSPRFFRDTAVRITKLLANSRYVVLKGQDHGAEAAAVASVVAEFFSAVTV
jgi:pimeloyl-ACP methyl ester carboxylesterase